MLPPPLYFLSGSSQTAAEEHQMIPLDSGSVSCVRTLHRSGFLCQWDPADPIKFYTLDLNIKPLNTQTERSAFASPKVTPTDAPTLVQLGTKRRKGEPVGCHFITSQAE